MAGLIIRGGFPANIVYSPKDWSETISEYIKIIIEDDLIRLDGVNRDKYKVKLLLKSLFEALVERDLKIYADSFNAKCYHYQDYQNKEIDSVIELEDGNWCAFEIKLGANKIEEAAKNLLKIKEEIKKENGKVPAVLCVICGLSNAAYQRPDGVYVVPITALRP